MFRCVCGNFSSICQLEMRAKRRLNAAARGWFVSPLRNMQFHVLMQFIASFSCSLLSVLECERQSCWFSDETFQSENYHKIFQKPALELQDNLESALECHGGGLSSGSLQLSWTSVVTTRSLVTAPVWPWEWWFVSFSSTSSQSSAPITSEILTQKQMKSKHRKPRQTNKAAGVEWLSFPAQYKFKLCENFPWLLATWPHFLELSEHYSWL